MDFSNFNFQVIDINTNASPDMFVNKYGVTFTKRILSDLNYAANVQYCLDAQNHIFAIRGCKSNEAKATPFSKPEKEQKGNLTIKNQNLLESILALMEGYEPEKKYRIEGNFDYEHKVMLFDMTTAEETDTYHNK